MRDVIERFEFERILEEERREEVEMVRAFVFWRRFAALGGCIVELLSV